MSAEAVLSGTDSADQGILRCADERSEEAPCAAAPSVLSRSVRRQAADRGRCASGPRKPGAFSPIMSPSTPPSWCAASCRASTIRRFTRSLSMSSIPRSATLILKDRRGQCWATGRCFCASAKASAFRAKNWSAAKSRKTFCRRRCLARVGWLDIALSSNHILEQVAVDQLLQRVFESSHRRQIFSGIQRSLWSEAARYRIFRRAWRSRHRAQQHRLRTGRTVRHDQRVAGPRAESAAQRTGHLVGDDRRRRAGMRKAKEVRYLAAKQRKVRTSLLGVWHTPWGGGAARMPRKHLSMAR